MMKSEYYTLHSNGSFERISGAHPSQQKKEGSGSSRLLTKSRIISASNLVLAAILGISVIVIVALHISQSTEFYISHIIQVDRYTSWLTPPSHLDTAADISESPSIPCVHNPRPRHLHPGHRSADGSHGGGGSCPPHQIPVLSGSLPAPPGN